MPAEDWAVDMVLVEFKRVGPEQEVTQSDLQERTGIGGGELRAVIEKLEEDGHVISGERGWTYAEGVIGQQPLPPSSDDPGETPVDEPEGAEELPEGAEVADPQVEDGPQYEAMVLVRVRFYPEPREGETTDVAAVREAEEQLRPAALYGIAARYPDLTLSGWVHSVLAYDTPRRVR